MAGRGGGRGQNGRSMSHLDRIPESHCNKVIQICLSRLVSDHFPILLDSDGVRTSPSSFRFELMWLKFEGFKEILKGWWQNLQFHGSFSFILTTNLKALKGILKTWNREVFGRVEANKKDSLCKVTFWDGIEKERELGLEEVEERAKAIDDFKGWALMEETSWR